MVAAISEGPDVDRIAQLTGYSLKFVNKVGSRLIDSGLWKNGPIDYQEWDPKTKNGVVCFLMGRLDSSTSSRSRLNHFADDGVRWHPDFALPLRYRHHVDLRREALDSKAAHRPRSATRRSIDLRQQTQSNGTLRRISEQHFPE
jgi:hypothetical protein